MDLDSLDTRPLLDVLLKDVAKGGKSEPSASDPPPFEKEELRYFILKEVFAICVMDGAYDARWRVFLRKVERLLTSSCFLQSDSFNYFPYHRICH